MLLFAAWAAPAIASAQFQDPTPDELKMTSDPKAPGASAVYLYLERDTDDVRSYQTIYERIKVLTEKGKDLATIRIPYVRGEVKVTDIQGRTIHADGTVIPLSAKPDDLVQLKTKNYQENSTVFTLPSVEVGSILEYRLNIRRQDNLLAPPYWDIQQPYFVHKEHFRFRPGEYYGSTHLMEVTAPRDAKIPIVQDHGAFTIDLIDVPPTPSDDWMPPINTIREHAEFYYTSAISGEDYWKKTGDWYAKGFESFTNPSGKLKDAAAGIVSPSDTDEQKARKIYAAIMKLDNTEFSRVKSEAERKKEKLKSIRNASDIWKNQAGTANEMAMLYVALARAVGLKATPMWLAPRSESIFDMSYLSVDQLTDFIVLLELDGKTIYLDPGQRYCPFGKMIWSHNLAGGLQFNSTGAVIGNTPPETFKDNSSLSSADLTIDDQGNVQGTVRINMAGNDAIYWRQKSLENDPEEVKKQFLEEVQDELPEGVDAKFDHFVAMDDYESVLMAVLQISGSIGAPSGKYLILPGLFFSSRSKHPFTAQSNRATPIDVHFPRLEKDDVDYHLPAGYTVEGSPKTKDLKWPGLAALGIDSGVKDEDLRVVRVFARNFTLLSPDKYSDLHDFYLKMASADQQQIVLVHSAAQKGN
ncbi:MAG TPA: DUF3857 and transglutaminase domain-containing protein [Terracidiphilus sp.]|nr:DUF3857 and transglutaminase domain-containing protein [Terracidiphilus sp.]